MRLSAPGGTTIRTLCAVMIARRGSTENKVTWRLTCTVSSSLGLIEKSRRLRSLILRASAARLVELS